MSIIKIALAIVIAFFMIVAIFVVVILIINHYWGQIIQQQIREELSNPFNFSLYSTPNECIQNPDSVICKLEFAKQKAQQLPN